MSTLNRIFKILFFSRSSSMTLCYLASETNISQISETENSLSLHNEFEVYVRGPGLGTVHILRNCEVVRNCTLFRKLFQYTVR